MNNSVRSKFIERFQSQPLVISSPGRINLIGEHTDYNNGFVMPAAIDKGITFAIGRKNGNTSMIYSMKYGEQIIIDHSKLDRIDDAEWPNYLLGVLYKLTERGYKIPSFNCVFDGDLPTGSGLSSSAALECGFIFALDQLFDLNLERSDMIQMAQWAEHNYAGVKCGIMDQFASMMGKKGNAILLDCQSLEYHYFPVNLGEHYQLLLCDTGVKHSLASSEYNTRRKECEQGVEILSNMFPLVRSLRNASTAMVNEQKDRLPVNVYKRCLYVTQEIARVLQAKEHLSNGDLKAFGELMFQTHGGLSRLYEVSCPELDFLVDHARQNTAVLGARMMGGGFGGSTLNLIEKEATPEFIQSLSKKYHAAFGIDLKAHVVTIADGTAVIENQIAVL